MSIPQEASRMTRDRDDQPEDIAGTSSATERKRGSEARTGVARSRFRAAAAARFDRLRHRQRGSGRRLSEVLDQIGSDTSRERVSVADLLRDLSGRALGALLLIFALPNVLPAPPGVSGLLGLPLVYLSAQMMLGRIPWLPPFIANRSITREDFAATVQRLSPLLVRAERLLKPRLAILVHHRAERLIGLVCLMLALVLLLPIPLGNMLPALAISVLALGVMERDGLCVIGGIAIAGVALTVVAGVIYAMALAAAYVLSGMV